MGAATARLWRGFWCRFGNRLGGQFWLDIGGRGWFRFWMRSRHRGWSCGLVVFQRFRFGSLDGRDIRGRYAAKLSGTLTLFYKQDGNARDAAGKSEEND